MNISHPELVKALCKPGEEIVDGMNPHRAHLLHMGVGVCGEAGELMDAIKQSAIYFKPINRDNVVEELGDLEFYMEGLRQKMKITREETLAANIEKLSKRYHQMKYSDEQAAARADKQGPEEQETSGVRIVHHLNAGVAACTVVVGLPKDWPAGHLWSADWNDVTCAECRKRLLTKPITERRISHK